MMFHDGKVNSVTGRKMPMPQNNLLSTLNGSPINRQHLIDDSE